MSLISYLKETKGELKHVSWPTRKQTIFFTIIVVVLSIFTAVLLGIFDRIFAVILENII
ncbi:MAG TPA: preprotein translocase subunit SecE [Candidatus Yonathbacteria bacterium]|nr:preprotein translocase subunit SecE [Candidatus Yonathbacteria bacterium]